MGTEAERRTSGRWSAHELTAAVIVVSASSCLSRTRRVSKPFNCCSWSRLRRLRRIPSSTKWFYQNFLKRLKHATWSSFVTANSATTTRKHFQLWLPQQPISHSNFKPLRKEWKTWRIVCSSFQPTEKWVGPSFFIARQISWGSIYYLADFESPPQVS